LPGKEENEHATKGICPGTHTTTYYNTRRANRFIRVKVKIYGNESDTLKSHKFGTDYIW